MLAHIRLPGYEFNLPVCAILAHPLDFLPGLWSKEMIESGYSEWISSLDKQIQQTQAVGATRDTY
jgi:hypothetical protein